MEHYDNFKFAVRGGADCQDRNNLYINLGIPILVLSFPACTDKLVEVYDVVHRKRLLGITLDPI